MDELPPKPGSDYPGVSFEDAREYFQDKLSSAECELCKTDFWDVVSQGENTVAGMVIQGTPDFEIKSVIPLVVLACKNCGNLKLFRERSIHKYIAEKRLKAQSSGGGD